MPVVFTYELKGAPPADHNRIQSLFERLGWENLGGSSYRYPRLGTTDEEQPTEDWFNHVVPALMLFREFVLKSGTPLKKFTVDANSSTGYSGDPVGFGSPPLNGQNIKLYLPNNAQFGEKNLRDWLDPSSYPY